MDSAHVFAFSVITLLFRLFRKSWRLAAEIHSIMAVDDRSDHAKIFRSNVCLVVTQYLSIRASVRLADTN